MILERGKAIRCQIQQVTRSIELRQGLILDLHDVGYIGPRLYGVHHLGICRCPAARVDDLDMNLGVMLLEGLDLGISGRCPGPIDQIASFLKRLFHVICMTALGC